MMDMQKYVMQTLEGIGVPISYVARGESRLPLIVFNVTNERGICFGMMKKQLFTGKFK